MSEASKPAQHPEFAEKAYRRLAWTQYLIAAIPLLVAAFYLIPGQIDSPLEDRIAGAVGWVVVDIAIIAALYAIHRVQVNLYFNRRPFTEKDRKYCKRASSVVFCGAWFLIGFHFLEAGRKTGHAIGLTDVVTAQFVCLVVLSAVLKVMTRVHERGARYFDELERGV